MSSLKNRILQNVIKFVAKEKPGLPLAEVRRRFDADLQKFVKRPAGMVALAASGAPVPAEWIKTTAETKGTILHLHGGGFVLGSIASHRNASGHIARHSGTRVLLPGFRLAPEHPFPGSLADCETVYRWLIGQAGIDPCQLVLLGDSSGGALALALMMTLREKHLPQPAAAVLISPWADLSNSGASLEQNRRLDVMCSRAKLDSWARQYVGEGQDLRQPLASPAFGEFHGLPPLQVLTSTSELLYSDAQLIVRKAREASVNVEAIFEPEILHVWPLFGDLLTESSAALAQIGTFVRGALASASERAA